MKQSQIANQICLSTNTLQRYRKDINMLRTEIRTELTLILPKNERKRFQMVILTTIHTTSLTLKDLK